MKPRSSVRISQLNPRPRPICHSTTSRRAAAAAAPHGSRHFAERSNRDEELPSFRSQLYESTAARVQREREEEERFSAMPTNRYDGDPGRKGAATVMWNSAWMLGLVCAGVAGYSMGKRTEREPDAGSTAPLARAVAPRHDTRGVTLQAAWADMVEIVGKANVSTDEGDRAAHAGSDWSSYAQKDEETPFMVVRPGSTDEVARLMKVCHDRRIPVTPYSGGTSLEGHFAPTRGGVCVDFVRMDQILRLDLDDLDVVVQPSVGWEALNDELAEHGLFFPPDPGPGAMIGGMIGTGCSGTNAYRYGTMKDWVLSLTVVLADGTVIKTRQRPRKSSAGYDLTRAFVGSEGTLGLVTEAVLKVTTRPAKTSVAVCAFPSIKQ
ncbi:MAG: FAD-binding protein, partial [Terriglobus roseus]|nr:FAD-binding protein [Terriglobus roseus]